MPRPLVYGNGILGIAFDAQHRARDLFYPQIGYPNHLLGHEMRVGFFVDGELNWCDSDDWDRFLDYDGLGPAGKSLWRSWKLGIELEVCEWIESDRPRFFREFRIRDLRGQDRQILMFFNQHFILGQSDVGNTALFHPFSGSIVHYRGPHVFAITAKSTQSAFDQYATGLSGFGDMEGTWRDAEDGELSMNPIAQGRVDSTIRLSVTLGAQGTGTVTFTLAAGSNLAEATDLIGQQRVECRKFDVDHLDSLVAPELSKQVSQLFYRSLNIIQTQIDSGGAILAANDSDILKTNRATYSYCWPRDGALTSMTMAQIGRQDVLENFLTFCQKVYRPEYGVFLQKYRSDSCLGASWHPWILDGIPQIPYQQDESALVLHSIEYCSGNMKEAFWNTLGKPLADQIVSSRNDDGMPLPSYDLWEERHGVHFFTVCADIAGLRSAFAISGEIRYKSIGDELLELLFSRFLSEGSYCRMICKDQSCDCKADSAVIGGLLLLGPEAVKRAEANIRQLEGRLKNPFSHGGYSRYEADYYFRQGSDYPGNPWVISTLWFARALSILDGKDVLLNALEEVSSWAEQSGVLAEQYHPETGEPLSVSPLTWSHAEFVQSVLECR